MTGPTWESSTGLNGSEGRPRSDSNEPWDERTSVDHPAVGNGTATNNHNNSTTTMRRDPYQYDDEEELEDGDLPRLNLSRSTSNGNDRNRATGTNAKGLHENIRKMAGGEEELKKQQAFWKQLDATSTMTGTNDEEDDTSVRRKRRFDKGKIEAAVGKATGGPKETANDRRPQTIEAGKEAREDTRSRELLNTKNSDPVMRLRMADSKESDETRESKDEYVEGEGEEINFCDHTLSAMESICGDAGLQAFCGGGPAPNTKRDRTISNPNIARNENESGDLTRRKKAKNLNILNARDESDSVDEHTAIEVEYVEPEDTSGPAQERPENWSPTRKNAYLAAMARKAKEDFEKSQAKEISPSSSPPKRKTNAATATTDASAQDVYNSFNAAEKRKFLRLINSGMTPTESAQRVHAEREKSKEAKPSKKGKLFKFWKKGKSKTNATTSAGKLKLEPNDRDSAGFPLENHTFAQEEKKEDDRRPTAEPRLEQNKDVSNASDSSSEATTVDSRGSPSQSQTHSQSQSHSSYDEHQKESGSESRASRRSMQHAATKVDERGDKSAGGQIEERAHDSFTHAQQVESTERPKSSLPGNAAVSQEVGSPYDPISRSLDTSHDGKDGAPFAGRFAKSGINYYDAVRRELSESEDETEFSNQVSVSSKGRSSRGPRLGPILQSPKLQGFSKLTKGGSKANRVMEKYAQDPASKADSEGTIAKETSMDTPNPPEGRGTRMFNDERPAAEEEKTEIDAIVENQHRDFPFSENITEYGTANFDVPVRNSESRSSSIETPSKAEEEALERIEKELLRPVRNIASLGSTPAATKASRGALVTPDSSGRVTTPRSQKKSAERLRDQIVAVVSPETVATQVSTPVSLKAATSSSSAASPSSAIQTPASAQESHASYSGARRTSESLPSPAKLSPILASVARSSAASSPMSSATKGTSLGPTQEDLDFDMQEYLNSTEVYSQAGQVNDSMSTVSGKSFTTADHGGSVYTQASTLTQSSRKRRPGAAKTRLAKAKAAERQTSKKKGWHDSIRAAAESTNRVWKPKSGWSDYAEDSFGNCTVDLSSSVVSSEKMHLNLSVGKGLKHQEDAPGNYPPNEIFQIEQEAEVPAQHQEKNEGEQDEAFVPPFPNEEEAKLPEVVSEQEPTTSKNAETLPVSVREQTNIYPESPPQQAPPVETKSEKMTGQAKNMPMDAATFSEMPPQEKETPSWVESNQPEQKKPGHKDVTHLSVNTSYLPLDESFLDVPPAPETDYPSSLGARPETPPEKPIPLSLEDMSLEESVAHSVDQFVQSVGAASPAKSVRRKTAASSPLRRKTAGSSPKRRGWVDSMRAATTNIEKDGQSWDPMTGWALADNSLVGTALHEDFAPPSTRFEQATIEERQTEASENDSAELVERQEARPAKDESTAKDLEPTNDLPIQSNEEGGGRHENRQDEGHLLDTAGAFPTVDVVKEKVDEEEFSWFPQRRSSSMVAVEESPEEQNGPAVQGSTESSSKSSRRSRDPNDVDEVGITPEESEHDGVIWNGVVFETGSYSQTPMANASSSTRAESARSTQATDYKAEASKSGSSASSKSSFSKTVPKLSQNKRDTSPIRAKAAQQGTPSGLATRVESSKAEFASPSPSEDVFSQKVDNARTISAMMEAPMSKPDENPNFPNAGEQARALRSVWRNAASPSSSPNRGGTVSIRKGTDTGCVDWPEHETEQTGMHSDDRYFSRDEGAFPSAMDAPSSPGSSSSNVRLRAQQWESRLPKDTAQETEELYPVGNSHSRLNAATGNWLGKKVRAESAAAAVQGNHQQDVTDAIVRGIYGAPADSLFDFSVDGSVDSRVQSHKQNGATVPQGQPTRNHMEQIPQQEQLPRQHQMADSPQNHAPNAPNEDSDSAPTELSDYSDGNEINKPFLARLAGCAGPMMKKGNRHGSDALAHLTFLRTNAQGGKHGNSRLASLCGRPDAILEEPAEGDEADDTIEEKKVTETDASPVLVQTKNVHATTKGSEMKADTRSVISEDFGAKTAYLEALAMKTAVSKPRRSDGRRRERSSAASDVSSGSSKLQQKEKWRDFLERKSKAGASPGKPLSGGSDASTSASAAENYAAKKVEEMMAMMASRSKSAPRLRSPGDPDNSRFVEDAIREHTSRHDRYDRVPEGGSGQSKRNNQSTHRSDSLVAAEQLASARVNAMMQALASDSSKIEEGEI